MQKRRRFKQQLTLRDRLVAWSTEIVATANALPPGPERDAMIKRARQADVAVRLDDWAKSPRLAAAEVGTRHMTSGYYAFVIGGDGHICNRFDIQCETDDEAIDCAEQLVDGQAIELWQGARKVATLQPKD